MTTTKTMSITALSIYFAVVASLSFTVMTAEDTLRIGYMVTTLTMFAAPTFMGILLGIEIGK